MHFKARKYDLELINEPTYTPGSADNVRSYAREYDFTDAAYRPSSRHGLVLREGGVVRQSCILLAGGGASGVHEHSIAIVDNTCFVAVGEDCPRQPVWRGGLEFRRGRHFLGGHQS